MADVDDLRDRSDRWQRCIEARDVHGVAEFLDDDYTLVLVQPARSFATRDQWLKTLPDYHEHEWRVQERVVEVDGDVGVILQRVYMRATVHSVDRSGILPKDLTANVVGLASGVLIGAAVVAGVAALGISAPAVVVGIAAVAIGGAVAIGVGDAVSEAFHEHWDEDIHKYGLVSGIGSGLANVGTNTVKDMADLGGKTKDAVGGGISSLWHGIFH